MLDRLFNNLIANPWLIVACVSISMVPALSQLIDFETLRPKHFVDPSMAALFPRDGDTLKVFQETQKHFATDDVLLVAWFADDLFSPEHLGGIKRFTRRIERLPGVVKVESLASELNFRAQKDTTVIDPFLRELPADQHTADLAREEALANPLFSGRLVSADGRGALIAVHFDPSLSTQALIEQVDRISRASAEEAGGVQQCLSGPLFVRLEFGRILLRDLYHILPIAILGTLLVAGLGFRTARGILIPLSANIVSLVGTLALFVSRGHALNFVTVILPPVVYVVGFAYAIHVVHDFDRHFHRGLNRAQAVRAAFRDVFTPLTLTAMTTAIGFISLTLSNIDSIRLFGLYAGLGVALSWITALTVVPAGLIIMPARRKSNVHPDPTRAVARRLTNFNLTHQRLFLFGGSALAIISFAAAINMEVSTNVLQNFTVSSSIRQNFERIGSTFAGTVPMRVLIRSDNAEAFKDPKNLKQISELQTWLKKQPEVGGSYSLVDYIGLLHQAIVPDASQESKIPSSMLLTNHLLLLGGGEDLSRFADASFANTLVHVRVKTDSTSALLSLTNRIETRLAKLPPPLSAEVTGTSYLIARTVDDITRGQLVSLTTALIVIYLVLVALSRSFLTAALALIPSALPILIYFGILGVIPTTLNITTSLIASAVLGIAIDDSIHFFSRYSAELRRTGSRQDAVEHTLAALIQPVTLTTAALCVGFLAVTTGELRSQAEFGFLSAVTLAVAWALDLTFTPALCASAKLRQGILLGISPKDS